MKMQKIPAFAGMTTWAKPLLYALRHSLIRGYVAMCMLAVRADTQASGRQTWCRLLWRSRSGVGIGIAQ